MFNVDTIIVFIIISRYNAEMFTNIKIKFVDHAQARLLRE